MSRGRVLTAWLSLVVMVGITFLVAPAAGAPPGPDVEVAVRESGKCRQFADQLPALFSASGIQPGDRTPRVDVCIRNRGRMDARLTLTILERVELDVGCTGDEPSVDVTCGSGQAGDLGPNLVLILTTQPECRGPTTTPIEFNLVGLESVPAVLNPTLRSNRTDCIGLAIEHRPMSEEAAAAAQTDRVSWRFAFDLST